MRPWIPAPKQYTGSSAGKPSLPVGICRASRDGSILRKVSETGWEREHRLVAEKALGHKLPEGAIVYHVDEDKSNNSTNNLLICPDKSYVNALKARRRVQKLGKDPFLYRFHNSKLTLISEIK